MSCNPCEGFVCTKCTKSCPKKDLKKKKMPELISKCTDCGNETANNTFCNACFDKRAVGRYGPFEKQENTGRNRDASPERNNKKGSRNLAVRESEERETILSVLDDMYDSYGEVMKKEKIVELVREWLETK